MKKTRPLKIYLGDLTYTTVTIATEAFPLNVGYIASYCKKLFGNDVEITLFKYIDEIDKAVNENPPDILAMSNYAWCHRIGREISKIFSKNLKYIHYPRLKHFLEVLKKSFLDFKKDRISENLPEFNEEFLKYTLLAIKETYIIEFNARSGRIPAINWKEIYSAILIGDLIGESFPLSAYFSAFWDAYRDPHGGSSLCIHNIRFNDLRN